MDCWAIIPAKPFRAGKSRLAALLGVDERAALNRRLFGRVLDAALGTFPSDRDSWWSPRTRCCWR